ncbi:gamma-glutamyl-gamma-aminobutyrate hydrolase family protein [Pseudohoeflea coraliihabitans]|uniref:Gamma-glutamyl-gamma-aminobutyrate hydrolase family protein n=1 Tax=Pseudohoeflea coraliihabitans TaxID=2860393 RepID=A0ABS6WK99_9HYPH|nr:gamma-glutamyl-gamma-aminobutyrate hydrolase family protein [Pseudohoeflea sp. DP4N28-3]MBW3096373.1 gamma-glutamyl-gamma-aminobutyrate hydrolase family protein [Pseudohoeflea sp. DP4N28-3]
MQNGVVAIPADIREFEGYVWQAAPEQYVQAAIRGSGVQPLIVPALEVGFDADQVLDRVDGLLISGSRTNVHPSHYGIKATEGHGPFDPARDATSMAMIRRAIERGLPLLAICRGIQELNVALGGTLANEIQELPGRSDHRKPEVPDRDEAFAVRHPIAVQPGGCLAAILEDEKPMVNSLHRQGISDLAPRLTVEALAEDETIEAVSVIDAPGFALGVQWHPEYWVGTDPTSDKIFQAFGAAVRRWRLEARPMQAAE